MIGEENREREREREGRNEDKAKSRLDESLKMNSIRLTDET